MLVKRQFIFGEYIALLWLVRFRFGFGWRLRWSILLQVLDDGRLTDAKGRAINFKNTIIIMTSNIGSEFINKMESIGFSNAGDVENYTAAKEKVLASLKDNFRPEFLNRLDDVVVFDILSPEAIKEIVNIQIDIIKKRLLEKEVMLSVSDNALAYLTKEGYNPHYGARPLKRLIQDKILTAVASFMISQGILKGGEVFVDAKNNEINVTVSKKGNKEPRKEKLATMSS